MKFDRGTLEICAFGADGFPNLSRPKICDCSAHFRTTKRRWQHTYAFRLEIEITPRRMTINPFPPMPPRPKPVKSGIPKGISREALLFLFQFDLVDKTMARILNCHPQTVASIRRDELGIMDGGWTFPPDHPCEICGEPSQIGPDKRNKTHGWICQRCRITTTHCNAMHRLIFDHDKLLAEIKSARRSLERVRRRKSILLPKHRKEIRWLKENPGRRNRIHESRMIGIELTRHREECARCAERASIHEGHRYEFRYLLGALERVNAAIKNRESFIGREEIFLPLYMEAQLGGSMVEDDDFIDSLLRWGET